MSIAATTPTLEYQTLTFPHGFAMKLGTTPWRMPTLFARNLKSAALSAIRNALVYARAVSRTPGPVSVSERGVRLVREGEEGEIAELRGQVEDQTYGGPRSAHRTSAHRQKVAESMRHSAGCVTTNSRALCKVRFNTLSEGEKAAHFPASAVAGCESPFLRGWQRSLWYKSSTCTPCLKKRTDP